MLDRLEKAGQKTQMLELQMRARDDLPDKTPAPRETGYVPPPDKPLPGLDPETERLVLMTPRDYQFPIRTHVTDITGRRLEVPVHRQPQREAFRPDSPTARQAISAHSGEMTSMGHNSPASSQQP